MNRLRRHLSPLNADTISPLNLPPVQMGLLTKLNLLTVGLIFLTAVATTGLYLWKEWRLNESELRTQGSTLAVILSEALRARHVVQAIAPISTRILDSLAVEGDVAYARVLDAQRRRRRRADVRGGAAECRRSRFPARFIRRDRDADCLRPTYDRRAALHRTGIRNSRRSAGRARPERRRSSRRPAIRFHRLRTSRHDLRAANRRVQADAHPARSVVALLVVLAIVATLMLTRRLVAPMRRLMRAARAVGSGKLDVYVPARSSRRARAPHAHVQPHDAAARRIAVGGRDLPAHARGQGRRSARKELEIATAHAYKLAQHDILTGLPNRSLLNQRLKQILAQAQRDGTHVACLFLDFDHFKRINDTLGHDAGDQLLQAIAQRLTSPRCANRTPSRVSAATSSS